MTAINTDTGRLTDPQAPLEQAFIDEFLQLLGLDAVGLRALPEREAKRLQAAASVYAGAKLAEVDARARFVHEIHSQR